MPHPKLVPTITLEDVTLRDIIEQRYDLVFQCTGCLKVSRMNVLELVHKFGPETKLEPIRFKLRWPPQGSTHAVQQGLSGRSCLVALATGREPAIVLQHRNSSKVTIEWND